MGRVPLFRRVSRVVIGWAGRLRGVRRTQSTRQKPGTHRGQELGRARESEGASDAAVLVTAGPMASEAIEVATVVPRWPCPPPRPSPDEPTSRPRLRRKPPSEAGTTRKRRNPDGSPGAQGEEALRRPHRHRGTAALWVSAASNRTVDRTQPPTSPVRQGRGRLVRCRIVSSLTAGSSVRTGPICHIGRSTGTWP